MSERAARAATDWPMAERSVVPSVLGVAAQTAVGGAFGMTLLGVLADLLTSGTLGIVFTILYVAGCVLAMAWVRRDSLFWPIVAPPLLLAIAVPAVVLLAGRPKPGSGMAERLLIVGAPLVNAFPTMAWTTVIVVALGVFRIVTQRAPQGQYGQPSAPETSNRKQATPKQAVPNRTTKGRTSKGRTTEARTTQNRTTQRRTTEGRTTQSRTTEARTAQGSATQARLATERPARRSQTPEQPPRRRTSQREPGTAAARATQDRSVRREPDEARAATRRSTSPRRS